MQHINAYAGSPRYASRDDLRAAARPRRLTSSKRDNGSVLIIGGSSEYHGAPILAARAVASTIAALRIGTGYAVLCVPSSIEPFARKLSPNTIIRAVGEGHIGRDALAKLKESIGRADSLAIGMGIGRRKETMMAVGSIVGYAIALGKKVVVDADAIYAVNSMRMKLSGNCMLTPQQTEFSALNGTISDGSREERISKAVEAARRLGSCVLLKGHETVITDGSSVVLNRTRHSSLATMGTGDILSGIIAGYAATGCGMFKAGVAGAYLHGKVGDLLNREKGNHILALDMADAIPRVIKQFDREIM